MKLQAAARLIATNEVTAADDSEFKSAQASLEKILGKPTTQKKGSIQWGEKGEEVVYTLNTSEELTFIATIDYTGRDKKGFMAHAPDAAALIKGIKARVKEYKERVHPREYTEEISALLKLKAV